MVELYGIDECSLSREYDDEEAATHALLVLDLLEGRAVDSQEQWYLVYTKKWKAWETETTSLEYKFSNDPSRFRLTHQTSFVKRNLGLSSTTGIRWIDLCRDMECCRKTPS
ncbi:hypothetical protein J5N97_013181 [Dioscorea zingiberensis]|uniref:Uncharacterized protein n=1 Tax=Dioscorea zingiberensis TaxID=325984 RepID=A0A9D5CRP4_9LILI|nr:hypothetical protein J5N97_013181 [Dioscorea zingiberensis]